MKLKLSLKKKLKVLRQSLTIEALFLFRVGKVGKVEKEA